MRCTSFCTSELYKLQALANFLKANGYVSKNYRKVLHLKYPNMQGGDVFIFSYGCLVTWGLSKVEEQQLLKLIEPFAQNLLSSIESDRFVARFGQLTEMVTHEHFNADVIVLESDSVTLKLAISHGLAQSIQLESYESVVQKTIEKNAAFPEQLIKTGKISLSQRAIFKRMGEIFVARSYINLNSEYLADPEFFWENPNLEEYYAMSKKFLDIPRRVSALNQKLDILHEVLDMLNNQLQHRHSSMLEMIIIVLILIEIIISLITVKF